MIKAPLERLFTKAKKLLKFFKEKSILILQRRINHFSLDQIVTSIPEYLYNSEIANHIVGMQVIRKAGIENYCFPGTLPPFFRTEMHFAKRHIYQLKDVLINPNTGACNAGGRLLQESYGSLYRCFRDRPFPVTGITCRISEPTTCVFATGYYHFLLEEIPRLLWVVDQCPEVKVCLCDNAQFFAKDLLDTLVLNKIISGYKIVSSRNSLQCDNYIFTQAEAYSGFVHSMDILKLRETFMPHFQSENKPKLKIYISRRNSARALDNESEVEESLTNLGYRIAHLEQMAFADQMSLMRNANTIVAPHGAGLVNLLWCQPGATVVEIFSQRQINDCYARLCSTLNLHYTPFWTTPTKGWGSVDIKLLLSIVK